MIKFLTLLFVLVLLMPICPESDEKIVGEDIKGFNIQVIRYYFGRKNIRITITPEKVVYETAVALNKKNYKKIERHISEKERKDICEFLTDFPLKELKENYYYKGVKDGMQLRFIIRIDNVEKNIFVANYYIKELGALAAEIVKLLTEDFINYNPETVPEIIEK